MPVAVTVGTALKLDLEQRVLAFRDMALRAFQTRMPALQRIRAGGVFLHGKRRGLPALHVVAGSALPAVRTLGELPVVRIGLVAVHALLEYQGLFEISVRVALGTIHSRVLALQRELGLRMVEALVDRLQRNLLPPARTVAGLAALREAPVMRVFVAIGALVKRNAHVLRLAVWSIGMALGALHLGMQAGQGIARLRVIELGLTGLADIDRLPIHKIVALQAVRSQAALVLILVTRDATRRETKICPARVLDFYGRAFLRRDVARIVAFITGQALVFAFEQVSRFFMIEGLDVPLDQREVFPVVFRVAAGAFLARAGRNVIGGV